MAKRKVRRKRRAAKTRRARYVRRAPKKTADIKLAIAILIFGMATAFSAVYKLGNITILFGLVTVAAALAMIVKKK